MSSVVLLRLFLSSKNVRAVTVQRPQQQITTRSDVDCVTVVRRLAAEPQLILNATVTYDDAKPGYYLTVGVFDLDDGNSVDDLGSSSSQPSMRAFDWSPDGTRILFRIFNNRIQKQK